MPVEIRTADGRHWARPAVQNHDPLPLIRLETARERRRRRVRDLTILTFGAAAIWLAGTAILAGVTP